MPKNTPSLRGLVVDPSRVKAASRALADLAAVRSRTRLADSDLKQAIRPLKASARSSEAHDLAYILGGVDIRSDAAEDALSRAISSLASWTSDAAALQERHDVSVASALGGPQ